MDGCRMSQTKIRGTLIVEKKSKSISLQEKDVPDVIPQPLNWRMPSNSSFDVVSWTFSLTAGHALFWLPVPFQEEEREHAS